MTAHKDERVAMPRWDCPDCGWFQQAHPRYGWAPHDDRAVEVHRTTLCPERATKREAAIEGMVAKGYTRERAEELFDLIGRTLFGPGGRFAREHRSTPGEQGDR